MTYTPTLNPEHTAFRWFPLEKLRHLASAGAAAAVVTASEGGVEEDKVELHPVVGHLFSDKHWHVAREALGLPPPA